MLIFFSFFISGLGISVIQPLGLSYYDDNVPPGQAPLFHGILSVAKVLGPFLGYILGSFCLRLHESFWNPPPGVKLGDPKWVGAWWLGELMPSENNLKVEALTSTLIKEVKEKRKKEKKGVLKKNSYMWWMGFFFFRICDHRNSHHHPGVHHQHIPKKVASWYYKREHVKDDQRLNSRNQEQVSRGQTEGRVHRDSWRGRQGSCWQREPQRIFLPRCWHRT